MASGEPLLRVHWPARLALPYADTTEVQLIVHRIDGAVQELVVTGAASGGGAPDAVGTLLLRWTEQPPAACGSSTPTFVLQPTRAPGGQLPILLHPGGAVPPPAVPAARRRSARLQQQHIEQQQSQPEWQCQIVMHDHASQLVFSSGGSSLSRPASTSRRMASQLASHLLGALLALLLLANRQAVARAATLGGSALAALSTRQLLWLMTAQPAGVKLHRQLCELLGVAGLQYVAVLRWLLAGRGGALAAGGTGLLAAALVTGGLLPGLVVLRSLLWALALPISLPYAAVAAAYRWQLHSTAVMWRVMRGRQRMPLIRQRLAAAARRWLRRSGSGAGGAGGQHVEPQSPRSSFRLYSSGGSGLKQLSGSMLLFMPLLLLLPTTACFYAFAVALHAACALPRAAALLAEQLLRHNPAAAALEQLLQPGGSGRSGSPAAQLQYSLLRVEWAPPALSAAEQQVVQRTAYLRAQLRHGSPRRAAACAAAAAWAACQFAPLGWTLFSALQGRLLFVERPCLHVW